MAHIDLSPQFPPYILTRSPFIHFLLLVSGPSQIPLLLPGKPFHSASVPFTMLIWALPLGLKLNVTFSGRSFLILQTRVALPVVHSCTWSFFLCSTLCNHNYMFIYRGQSVSPSLHYNSMKAGTASVVSIYCYVFNMQHIAWCIREDNCEEITKITIPLRAPSRVESTELF